MTAKGQEGTFRDKKNVLCVNWGGGYTVYTFVKTHQTEYFKSAVPNLFGTRDQIHGRQFFHRREQGGCFGDDSSALHLLRSLFLLLLHCNV